MIVLLAEVLGFFLALIGARGRMWIAWALAFLSFDVLRLRRALVMKNLARVFGPDTSLRVRAQVGRASVANFILTTLEFFSPQRVFEAHQVEVKNPEVMRAALAQGRGVYLMGIHMGNFELLGAAMARHFALVHAPVKPIGKGRMALWVKKRRARNGIVEIVNEKEQIGSRTTRLIAALRSNEIVGFMVDQRRTKGLLLPFFGELAWTNVGLMSLWKQHNAPIIPVAIRRTGLQSSEVTFYDELKIDNEPQWSKDEFVLQNAKKMNATVERMIMDNPKEYFWMHNRWKK